MATYEQFFPFFKLGLTRNPFGVLSVEEWVQVTVIPPIIHQILDEGFQHLEIISDKGRGKSTLLHWLCHHFRAQGDTVAYERLPMYHINYHTDIAPLSLFALDEAQRLLVWNRWRLLRQSEDKRLIIGTHRSLSRDFSRRGWQLTTVHIGNHTDRAHIQHIIDRRLMIFAAEQGTKIVFDASAIDYLWEGWRDNLRGMEYFLYHIMQKCHEPGTITADFLRSAGRDYVEPAGL